MMRKVIDVEFVVDIDKHECWAGIRTSDVSKIEEENAVIKLILSGIRRDGWIKVSLLLKEVDKLRNN